MDQDHAALPSITSRGVSRIPTAHPKSLIASSRRLTSTPARHVAGLYPDLSSLHAPPEPLPTPRQHSSSLHVPATKAASMLGSPGVSKGLAGGDDVTFSILPGVIEDDTLLLGLECPAEELLSPVKLPNSHGQSNDDTMVLQRRAFEDFNGPFSSGLGSKVFELLVQQQQQRQHQTLSPVQERPQGALADGGTTTSSPDQQLLNRSLQVSPSKAQQILQRIDVGNASLISKHHVTFAGTTMAAAAGTVDSADQSALLRQSHASTRKSRSSVLRRNERMSIGLGGQSFVDFETEVRFGDDLAVHEAEEGDRETPPPLWQPGPRIDWLAASPIKTDAPALQTDSARREQRESLSTADTSTRFVATEIPSESLPEHQYQIAIPTGVDPIHPYRAPIPETQPRSPESLTDHHARNIGEAGADGDRGPGRRDRKSPSKALRQRRASISAGALAVVQQQESSSSLVAPVAETFVEAPAPLRRSPRKSSAASSLAITHTTNNKQRKSFVRPPRGDGRPVRSSRRKTSTSSISTQNSAVSTIPAEATSEKVPEHKADTIEPIATIDHAAEAYVSDQPSPRAVSPENTVPEGDPFNINDSPVDQQGPQADQVLSEDQAAAQGLQSEAEDQSDGEQLQAGAINTASSELNEDDRQTESESGSSSTSADCTRPSLPTTGSRRNFHLITILSPVAEGGSEAERSLDRSRLSDRFREVTEMHIPTPQPAQVNLKPSPHLEMEVAQALAGTHELSERPAFKMTKADHWPSPAEPAAALYSPQSRSSGGEQLQRVPPIRASEQSAEIHPGNTAGRNDQHQLHDVATRQKAPSRLLQPTKASQAKATSTTSARLPPKPAASRSRTMLRGAPARITNDVASVVQGQTTSAPKAATAPQQPTRRTRAVSAPNANPPRVTMPSLLKRKASDDDMFSRKQRDTLRNAGIDAKTKSPIRSAAIADSARKALERAPRHADLMLAAGAHLTQPKAFTFSVSGRGIKRKHDDDTASKAVSGHGSRITASRIQRSANITSSTMPATHQRSEQIVWRPSEQHSSRQSPPVFLVEAPLRQRCRLDEEAHEEERVVPLTAEALRAQEDLSNRSLQDIDRSASYVAGSAAQQDRTAKSDMLQRYLDSMELMATPKDDEQESQSDDGEQHIASERNNSHGKAAVVPYSRASDAAPAPSESFPSGITQIHPTSPNNRDETASRKRVRKETGLVSNSAADAVPVPGRRHIRAANPTRKPERTSATALTASARARPVTALLEHPDVDKATTGPSGSAAVSAFTFRLPGKEHASFQERLAAWQAREAEAAAQGKRVLEPISLNKVNAKPRQAPTISKAGQQAQRGAKSSRVSGTAAGSGTLSFRFASDKRLEERREWEERRRMKEKIMKELAEIQRLEDEVKQAEEVKRMRAAQVIKAHPLPKYMTAGVRRL